MRLEPINWSRIDPVVIETGFWFDWPILRLWTLPGAEVVLVVVVLVVVDVTVVVVVVVVVVKVVVVVAVVVDVVVVVMVAAVVFVQAWMIKFQTCWR